MPRGAPFGANDGDEGQFSTDNKNEQSEFDNASDTKLAKQSQRGRGGGYGGGYGPMWLYDDYDEGGYGREDDDAKVRARAARRSRGPQRARAPAPRVPGAPARAKRAAQPTPPRAPCPRCSRPQRAASLRGARATRAPAPSTWPRAWWAARARRRGAAARTRTATASASASAPTRTPTRRSEARRSARAARAATAAALRTATARAGRSGWGWWRTSELGRARLRVRARAACGPRAAAPIPCASPPCSHRSGPRPVGGARARAPVGARRPAVYLRRRGGARLGRGRLDLAADAHGRQRAPHDEPRVRAVLSLSPPGRADRAARRPRPARARPPAARARGPTRRRARDAAAPRAARASYEHGITSWSVEEDGKLHTYSLVVAIR